MIAMADISVGAELQRLLSRGLFRVYLNDDVVGCELGGALKNVIALAAGIAQGIKGGDNTRSALMTRGLAEQPVSGSPWAAYRPPSPASRVSVTCW